MLGICNGFQILCEAGLLPGVLRPNASLAFVCRDVALVVERTDTPFTSRCEAGAGARRSPSSTARVLVRRPSSCRSSTGASRSCFATRPARTRTAPSATSPASSTPRATCFGLMPHPEHAVDPLLGSGDGALLLASLVDSARERLYARA